MAFARHEQAVIVYLITNKLNEKKYVGKTVRSLEVRWKEHQRAFGKEDVDFYISRSMRKHGVENFEVSVIEECASFASLDEAEKAWIKSLGTFRPGGYNLTTGSEGTPGRVVTEEQRKRISEAAKNKPPATEEHRRNLSIANSGENNAFYGKSWGRKGPLSAEAKRKISVARRGTKLSEEHKTNIAKSCMGREGPNLGKTFDDSVRAKMALSRKFPVTVSVSGVPSCTCLSIDDACALFKPERMSARKVLRIIKSEGSIGEFSFTRSRENISTLKKLEQKG